MMRKLFMPLAVVAAAMFAYAPVGIARVPYESTMLLVQKIFYFHFATWMAVTASVAGLRRRQRDLSLQGHGGRRPLRRRVGRAHDGLLHVRPGQRIALGTQGLGRLVAVGRAPDDGVLLELVFFGYLLVRKYGGPGAEKLAAAMGIFGAATAPFIYKSVDWWRTIHPQTTVMKTLGDKFPAAWNLVWFCTAAFLLLFVVMLAARVQLE